MIWNYNVKCDKCAKKAGTSVQDFVMNVPKIRLELIESSSDDYVASVKGYCFDYNAIYSGKPANPEPESELQTLPIWKYHAKYKYYRKSPVESFLDQLSYAKRTCPRLKKKKHTFDCFICSKKLVFCATIHIVPEFPF